MCICIYICIEICVEGENYQMLIDVTADLWLFVTLIFYLDLFVYPLMATNYLNSKANVMFSKLLPMICLLYSCKLLWNAPPPTALFFFHFSTVVSLEFCSCCQLFLKCGCSLSVQLFSLFQGDIDFLFKAGLLWCRKQYPFTVSVAFQNVYLDDMSPINYLLNNGCVLWNLNTSQFWRHCVLWMAGYQGLWLLEKI